MADLVSSGAVQDWQGPPFSGVYTDTMGGDVNSIISDRLDAVTGLANDAWDSAMKKIGELSEYDLDIPSIDIGMDSPNEPKVVLDKFYLLKAELLDKLRSDLAAGGTGLGADVEDAIWNKAVSRIDDELDKQLADIDSDWASRGFDMPPAMMAALKQEAQTNVNKRKADTNRDMTIEQARLAKEHQQYIISNSLNKEDFIIQALINKYRAQIDEYRSNADIALKNAEININNQTNTNSLVIQSMQNNSNIAAQLAASAMAAVSTSINWGFSGSASSSSSYQQGVSYSESQQRSNSYSIQAEE